MNTNSKSYRDLIVWQKAVDLVGVVYELTKYFPVFERYGLTSQMQRSAVSIPSNIAEGSYRGSTKDFRRFLMIAYGSGAELETQLIIAIRQGYIFDQNIQSIQILLSEVMRMINRLARVLS